MIDAAISAREAGKRTHIAPVGALFIGAALLARSGRMYTGSSVDQSSATSDAIGGGLNASFASTSSALGLASTPAEQLAVMKAVSDGESNFLSLYIAGDSNDDFFAPSSASLEALRRYGNFEVCLVRSDRTMIKRTVDDLLHLNTSTGINLTTQFDTAAAAASGSASLSAAGSGASREGINPVDWTVNHVCDWLEQTVRLGQYSYLFREAAVDGALLLSLEDGDLDTMLRIHHPLHRRKILQSIDELAYLAHQMGQAAERPQPSTPAAPQPLSAQQQVELIAKLKVWHRLCCHWLQVMGAIALHRRPLTRWIPIAQASCPKANCRERLCGWALMKALPRLR